MTLFLPSRFDCSRPISFNFQYRTSRIEISIVLRKIFLCFHFSICYRHFNAIFMGSFFPLFSQVFKFWKILCYVVSNTLKIVCIKCSCVKDAPWKRPQVALHFQSIFFYTFANDKVWKENYEKVTKHSSNIT